MRSAIRDWLSGRPLDDATLAEYLAVFEAGHSPAAAGGFRREGRARGRGQVVGVRWEQADAAAAVPEAAEGPSGG